MNPDTDPLSASPPRSPHDFAPAPPRACRPPGASVLGGGGGGWGETLFLAFWGCAWCQLARVGFWRSMLRWVWVPDPLTLIRVGTCARNGEEVGLEQEAGPGCGLPGGGAGGGGGPSWKGPEGSCLACHPALSAQAFHQVHWPPLTHLVSALKVGTLPTPRSGSSPVAAPATLSHTCYVGLDHPLPEHSHPGGLVACVSRAEHGRGHSGNSAECSSEHPLWAGCVACMILFTFHRKQVQVAPCGRHCSVAKACPTLCGQQHARLPWPSPYPGVCSNSCPLSW